MEREVERRYNDRGQGELWQCVMPTQSTVSDQRYTSIELRVLIDLRNIQLFRQWATLACQSHPYKLRRWSVWNCAQSSKTAIAEAVVCRCAKLSLLTTVAQVIDWESLQNASHSRENSQSFLWKYWVVTDYPLWQWSPTFIKKWRTRVTLRMWLCIPDSPAFPPLHWEWAWRWGKAPKSITAGRWAASIQWSLIILPN